MTLRKALTTFLALLLFASVGLHANDGKSKAPSAEFLLNNSAQGREFWIAIPGNDDPSVQSNGLEFYVTSSYDTRVNLEVPGLGSGRQIIPLKAMEVVTFSSRNGAQGTTSLGWEIYESEVKEGKGIRIWADKPISVYVLNGKPVTSEGYLALPTNVWGTQYMHLSYFDFGESPNFRTWAGGFVIVAAENDTRVDIVLRGKGSGVPNARTLGGRTIGTVIPTITLDRGETYMVRGNGQTIGQFDLSGSTVTSDKPVGFISFHTRTMLPFCLNNGRDHLVEMMPPVPTWGKKYISVEYQRDNKGDFFRAIASRPSTRIEMAYFDPDNQRALGRRSYFLQRAGDFVEDVMACPNPRGSVESIRGTAIWEGDKPFLLMHYSYSANWDLSDIFDPFMIIVTPVEQYLKSTVFQTPANVAYTNNFFNLIAETDLNDPEQKKLRSIVIDGDSVYKRFPRLLTNQVPGTNLHWVRMRMSPGAHRITSETRFGGYIYGFSNFDSYGWPAAFAFNILNERDTLPPVLTRVEECGDFTYRATELRNFGPPPDTAQIDQGISAIELVGNESTNYKLTYITAEEIVVEPKLTIFDFKLEVIDKTKDAFAVFVVRDRAGNFTIDSVRYVADRLVLEPSPIDFGSVRLGQSKTLTAKLRNPNNKIMKVETTRLLQARYFTMSAPSAPPIIEIPPRGDIDVTITYTPVTEHRDPSRFDLDSVEFETECAKFRFPVIGRGIRPCIQVEALWNAGSVPINGKVCKEQLGTLGLRISNSGTDTLTVTGVANVRAPFSVSTPTNPAFPFQIAPGREIVLTSVCFEPTVVGPDSILVTFNSDSQGDDCSPTSLWKGIGLSPGPNITSFDWSRRRVLTVHRGSVYVTNTGTADVNLTSVTVAPNPHFRIVEVIPPVSAANPYVLRPNDRRGAEVVVEYIPQTEATHNMPVVASFNNAGDVTGSLDGIGIIPKIAPTGWVFPERTRINTDHNGEGFVVIRNPSTSMDLTVESVDFDPNGPNRADFRWVTPPPTNFIVAMGDSISLPVMFRPTAVDRRLCNVNIRHDAAPGPDVNPRVNSVVEVEGNGFDIQEFFPQIAVTNLDFGTRLTCEDPVGTITITNPGDANLIIYGFEATGNTGEFQVQNQNFPITVLPSTSVNVQITFPNNAVGQYQMQLRILDNIDSAAVATIRGNGFTIPVVFRINTPDEALTPGTEHVVPLEVRCGDYAGANITAFTIELPFNAKYLRYSGPENLVTGIPTGWTATARTTGTDADHRLVLTFQGGPALSRDQVIAQIPMQILLGDSISFAVGLNATMPADRQQCILASATGDRISITGCFINGRLVSTSSSPYLLNPPTPNPVKGTELTFDYSVGLAGRVSFELINSNGERVGMVESKWLQPGAYSASISVNGLAAGVYTLNMVSGPYVSRQAVSIVR